MTYQFFSQLAGTWGLVMLCVMFVAAFTYALWPSNKDKFNQAATTPLRDVPLEGDSKTHSDFSDERGA